LALVNKARYLVLICSLTVSLCKRSVRLERFEGVESTSSGKKSQLIAASFAASLNLRTCNGDPLSA